VILESTLRILMMARKVTFQYTQGNGTQMPGFRPEPDILGVNIANNAPGLPFVFGSQQDIRYKAASEGWLSTDTLLNTAYATKFNENLVVNATLEPWKDLRIEITATKQQTRFNQEYFKANSAGQFPTPDDPPLSPSMNGSFTISYIAIGTIFKGENNNNISPVFENMKILPPGDRPALRPGEPVVAGIRLAGLSQRVRSDRPGGAAHFIPGRIQRAGSVEDRPDRLPFDPAANWRLTTTDSPRSAP